MATPYEYPVYFDFDAAADAGSPDPGTALLFPPVGDGLALNGVSRKDVSAPDLARAANAIYFNDVSRWPALSGGDAGSAVPLKTTMVDSPDGAALANWLASEHGPRSANFFPGIIVPLPLGPDVVTDLEGVGQDALDFEGTLPYVNPANTSNPDAIYALNWLLDNPS
jgi:hypothetical protein